MSAGAVRRWVNDEELSRIEACLDDDIPESKVHARGDIAILVSSHRALHAQAVALAKGYLIEVRSSWSDLLHDEESIEAMMKRNPLCQQAQALLEGTLREEAT